MPFVKYFVNFKFSKGTGFLEAQLELLQKHKEFYQFLNLKNIGKKKYMVRKIFRAFTNA